MQINRPNAATPQTLKTLSTQAPASSAAQPQEQVSLGQTQADQAMGILQQMAQARVNVGHQLISEVLEPAPAEFQEVSQATMPQREQVAQYLAEQTGAATDAFYLLATETKTLAQAAINAENRADFQAQAGATPNRETLLNEELGFLIEANIYQGMIPVEQLQQILPQEPLEGEKSLSAGSFIDEVRKHIPPEVAQEVSENATLNPLMQAFSQNPELRSRFASALDQNYQAALQINQGCFNYFGVVSEIMQHEMQAASLLAQQQNPA